MPLLTPGAERTAQVLSNLSGLDLNVVRAWIAHESAWGKSPAGANNYLNLRNPHGGWDSFSSPDEAANTYYWQLKNAPEWYGRILAQANSPAQQTIAAIAASPWDAGHYGGEGGPNLTRTYNQVVRDYAGGVGTISQAAGSAIVPVGAKQAAAPERKAWGTLHIPGDGDMPIGSYLKIIGGAVLLLAAAVFILAAIGLRSGVAGTAVEALPGGGIVKRAAKGYAGGVSERRAEQRYGNGATAGRVPRERIPAGREDV